MPLDTSLKSATDCNHVLKTVVKITKFFAFLNDFERVILANFFCWDV